MYVRLKWISTGAMKELLLMKHERALKDGFLMVQQNDSHGLIFKRIKKKNCDISVNGENDSHD